MPKYTKDEVQSARAKLNEWLKPAVAKEMTEEQRRGCWSKGQQTETPGTTVYTILTHVARSGMSRSIRLVIIEDGKPFDISYHVSRVLGESIDQKNGGIKVGGCGMDMGFHLVNALSYALHGHDHNAYPLAGYSLEHRWL